MKVVCTDEEDKRRRSSVEVIKVVEGKLRRLESKTERGEEMVSFKGMQGDLLVIIDEAVGRTEVVDSEGRKGNNGSSSKESGEGNQDKSSSKGTEWGIDAEDTETKLSDGVWSSVTVSTIGAIKTSDAEAHQAPV